jgi:uroporphyrinogen-III decarboxylase
MGLAGPNNSGNPIVFIPLHKGADGFMSDAQFKTFYWPSLKQVILGFIDEGCVPMLLAECSYDSRLSYLKELPKGKKICLFDRTDIARAKQEVGDTICLSGNVPASLIVSGTPDAVQDYCKNLIDTAGKDGGHIMSSGTALDEARPENLKAMCTVAREYGVY